MRADSPEQMTEQSLRGFYDLVVANRFFGATIDHIRRGGTDTQLERSFPVVTEWLKRQANIVPKGYEIMDYLLTVGDLITPAGLMNYFEPRNKTPTEVVNEAAASVAGTAAVSRHRLISVNPDAALTGKSRELANCRRDADRRIGDSIAASGPEAGFKTFMQEQERERALTEELGKMYHALRDSGMSAGKIEDSLSFLVAASIGNIRRRAYTTESNDWARRRSTLLSSRKIDSPPLFADLPEEDRKEAEREWKRQAREVRRRIRAMKLEEKK